MPTIPPPPRISDPESAPTVLLEYLFALYKVLAVEGIYVEAAGQVDAGTFDAGDLPDPATSTIAIAQNTANNAYVLAVQAVAKAEAAQAELDAEVSGQLTVTGAVATAKHTFAEAQEDTDYYVACTAAANSGGPAIEAFMVKSIAKTVDDFTITTYTAPGGGKSVTFDFQVMR